MGSVTPVMNYQKVVGYTLIFIQVGRKGQSRSVARRKVGAKTRMVIQLHETYEEFDHAWKETTVAPQY